MGTDKTETGPMELLINLRETINNKTPAPWLREQLLKIVDDFELNYEDGDTITAEAVIRLIGSVARLVVVATKPTAEEQKEFENHIDDLQNAKLAQSRGQLN